MAPIPTLFIHGNHECVNYLKELYLGGWVAPNIYYMGYSGVINFGGVRIGGISGIYEERDYQKGHNEYPPYRGGAGKSAYHVREYEVFKLSQVKEPMDVFMSHDWPRGIYHFGDKQTLLRKKPFFADEIARDDLGSVAAQHLLLTLKPNYWFSAHLHVKFAALLQHAPGHCTRFLALDKCLPGRDFIQILDIEPEKIDPQYSARNSDGHYSFYYDAEWLAVLRASLPLFSSASGPVALPAGLDIASMRKQMQDEGALIESAEALRVPRNFAATAPAYDPTNPQAPSGRMALPFQNPQTLALASTYSLPLPTATAPATTMTDQALAATSSPAIADFTNAHESNPDEIPLDFDES